MKKMDNNSDNCSVNYKRSLGNNSMPKTAEKSVFSSSKQSPVMHKTQVRNVDLKAHQSGSFSNDDGDGNEDVQKQ